MKYVWTEKAEERAKTLGLEPRIAGTTATLGYEPLWERSIIDAWLKKGYIEVKESDE